MQNFGTFAVIPMSPRMLRQGLIVNALQLMTAFTPIRIKNAKRTILIITHHCKPFANNHKTARFITFYFLREAPSVSIPERRRRRRRFISIDRGKAAPVANAHSRMKLKMNHLKGTPHTFVAKVHLVVP